MGAELPAYFNKKNLAFQFIHYLLLIPAIFQIRHPFVSFAIFCHISFPLSVDLWIKHQWKPGMFVPSAWEKRSYG